MKTIKFLLIAVIVLLAGSFFNSCDKESLDLQSSANKTKITTRSIHVSCEDCIDTTANPIEYYEKSDSKIVPIGKSGKTKTVDIVYYNTETNFVLKVKSTAGWADLIINGVSSWTNGPVQPNEWGVYTVALPTGYQSCDEYNFSLQVAGNGPQAVFAVEYQLHAICVGETVTDIDGNVYHTVVIGRQTWMKENLKTTHYNNGDPIPYFTGENGSGQFNPGYMNYNHDENIADVYGRLYTFYSVVTDERNIAPVGWHVATWADWDIMIYEYLLQGPSNWINQNAGPLKEAGTDHWMAPNTGATNSSGFTALPAGICVWWGLKFEGLGTGTTWRCKDGNWHWANYETDLLGWGWGQEYHLFSVRCVKDTP